MSNSKRQSVIIIGFGLIIISGVILYFALSSPMVSSSSAVSQTVTVSATQNNTSSSKATQSVADNNTAYPINLNDCTVDDLITLDGIGESKASAIIEYRELIGGYTSVEEIKNIKGIGDSIYEKIAPYLCV